MGDSLLDTRREAESLGPCGIVKTLLDFVLTEPNVREATFVTLWFSFAFRACCSFSCLSLRRSLARATPSSAENWVFLGAGLGGAVDTFPLAMRSLTRS
jgi:hypothetical protein